jgi:Co/Zn/Cd efflux system component
MVADTVISSDTAISLATVVVLLGASWRISWFLSRIDSRTEQLPKRVDDIEDSMNRVDSRVALMQAHVESLEDDINNLWAAYREDPPDRGRRARPPGAAPKPTTRK